MDQFLDSLINFDKENISDANLRAVQPYLANAEFDPDFIRSKSAAAAGKCVCVYVVHFSSMMLCRTGPSQVKKKSQCYC